MTTNIQALPTDVSVLILEKLDKTEDRAKFAMTSKQAEHAYSQGVKNQIIPDHRPIVEKIHELDSERSVIENFKMKSRCFKVITGTQVAGLFSGFPVFFSSFNCCCSLSTTVAKILCYTGVGLWCGCSLSALLTMGIFWKKCSINDHSTNKAESLLEKNRRERKALEKDLEDLKPPQQIAMEYEPSYQNPIQSTL